MNAALAESFIDGVCGLANVFYFLGFAIEEG